jgi:hypothetical protein
VSDLNALGVRFCNERRPRGEAFLGTAGRIRARHDGENAAASRGERIAIYSHYSSTGRVSAMVQSQLAADAAQGFEMIFVSMCASLNGDDVARLQKICRAIVARRSFGRDFGAWRDILSTDLVKRGQIQELLLSPRFGSGPIRPIEPLFNRMRMAEGLWGLINSDQNGSHLQSFFLLSRGQAAVDAAFAFFHNLRTISSDKGIVIRNGELSFSCSIARRGVPLWALYGLCQVEDAPLSDRKTRLETILSLGHAGIYECADGNPDASDDDLDVRTRNVMAGFPVNPTHQFGEVLVRRFDFPFIKTELLVVNPSNMSIGATWRSLVTEEAHVRSTHDRRSSLPSVTTNLDGVRRSCSRRAAGGG